MSDEINAEHWQAFQESMTERANWARLEITIDAISQENAELVQDLSQYDPKIAIPLIASLLTIPEYQSNCIRLEVLSTLATIHCHGKKNAQIDQAVEWFHQIGKSSCVFGEDPAEDVFVSLVKDPSGGDYRILEGVWEAAGFYTERVLEVVDTMPDEGHFGKIKRSVRALLKISDSVCERSELLRYQTGSDECHSELLPSKLPRINTLISRVVFSFEELEAMQIKPAEIEPFILCDVDRKTLTEQKIGSSALDRHPIIMFDEMSIAVVLPSAISVAVRDYILENVLAGGIVDKFDSVLSDSFAKTIFQTPLLGGQTQAPVEWQRLANGRCAAFHSEVDEGYVISFHIFLPSAQVHLPGGFKEISEDDGTITDALQHSIDAIVKQFSEESKLVEGLIIIAGCGWGKGYATKHIELDHPKWRVQSMPAADLIRASWLSEMSPLYYWRLQDGFETIGKAGVNILNVNGFLNLMGWVRSNDGHFVPHALLPEGRVSRDRPLMMHPPLNLLRDIRASSDQGYDSHSLQDENSQWHNLKRISPNPLFPSESSLKLYTSYTNALDGRLTAVYKGDRNYWITISAPNFSDKEIRFSLWKMLAEWLHRIAHVVDGHVTDIPTGQNISVLVEFLDSDPQHQSAKNPPHGKLDALCEIVLLNGTNASNIVIDTGYLQGFGIAENIAEVIIARTITQVYLSQLNVENASALSVKLMEIIAPNKEARSFHLFHARTFLDYTRHYLSKKLITIDSLDDAAAKIGLGWRVERNSETNEIIGRDDCNKFLAKIVDILTKEIVEVLTGLERISTVTRLVENTEKAHDKENHWKRTSAAVLGLHGRDDETLQVFVEQSYKFAGAGITSRILTEMAICECPLNKGAGLSDIVLSKLIARIALVVRFGGLSDAIRFNALPPQLTISPLGDILFRNEFGENVVEPMLSSHIGKTTLSAAGNQKKNYEEPEVTAKAKGRFPEEFWEIWEQEMGFDIDQARLILDCLEDKGIKEGKPIYTISLSETLLLIAERSLPKHIGKIFIDLFSLWPRTRWETIPQGFKLRDIYPWRFGRRLSFVTRPILRLDESDDPILLIAPNALRKGFTYVLSGAFEGSLNQDFFVTEQMKNEWWGKASEGHTFNSEVAKSLSKKGWIVRENIDIPEILNKKVVRNYGDIDVLAWKPGKQTILVIESKDLSLARNYSEIAALLSEYQGGERDGKADKLKRHLDRVQFMADHAAELSSFTGVKDPIIASWLICSGVVPMQFSKIEALKRTRVGSIEDVISI